MLVNLLQRSDRREGEFLDNISWALFYEPAETKKSHVVNTDHICQCFVNSDAGPLGAVEASLQAYVGIKGGLLSQG